jgi:hypothetical protein
MGSPSNPQDGQPFPVPYLSTEPPTVLSNQILDAFNREGLTTEQARQLMDRGKHVLDARELIARRNSH